MRTVTANMVHMMFFCLLHHFLKDYIEILSPGLLSKHHDHLAMLTPDSVGY